MILSEVCHGNCDTFNTVTTENYNEVGKDEALTKTVANGSRDFPINDFMVVKSNDITQYKTHPSYGGIKMRTLVMGETGVRMVCHIPKGHIEPPHYHMGRYEWFVMSGKHKFKNPITGKTVILTAGDYYCNPSGIPHQEICLEEGIILWLYDRLPDCHCMTDEMIKDCEKNN